MTKFSLHYVVRNNGDGSASANFYADAEAAQLASDIEDEGGEAYGDNPHVQRLEFDADGVYTNPDSTLPALKRDLAERRGEEPDEDDISAAFNNAAKGTANADGTFSVKLWYVVVDGGDGSASVSFYHDRAAADVALEIEQEYQSFNEAGPHAQVFTFDADGKLANPDASIDTLRAELAELRGEEPPVVAKPAAKTPKP